VNTFLMTPLSELVDQESIDHIVVFVADSLRFDHLPDCVRNLGMTARTISSSTFTGSSIPSLITGTYPSTHRVWGFDDVLPAEPLLLRGENRGLTTQNIWESVPTKQRPPLRILRMREETTPDDVLSADTSLVVIHDRGAHGPYNYSNVRWSDSQQFFSDLADNHERLRELYQRGCEDVGQRFVNFVKNHDRDDTLFVFTSDHGELLGETRYGGVFGHGTPISPELVTVPTVFIGNGIPSGEETDCLLAGVDIAPTLMAAQGREIPDYVEGVDCWNGEPSKNRIARSEVWMKQGNISYGAGSVWDTNGGIIQHIGGRLERIAFGYHRHVISGAQSPATRSLSPAQNWNLVRTFANKEQVYGNPRPDIRQHIITDFTSGTSDYDVPKPNAEHLKALGYLE